METPRHPFRKFVFGSASRAADGSHYSLTGARFGRPIRLTPPEFELASLFDGARDTDAVVLAARERLGLDIGAAEVERFANDLSLGDLLVAGRVQPLPVPAQTDAEAATAGWVRGARGAGVAVDAMTPSTVPNALTGPGLPGSVTGLWGQFRGTAAPLRYRLPIGLLLPLGSVLALPVYSLFTSLLLLVVAAVAVGFSVVHAREIGAELLQRFSVGGILLTAVAFGWLVNFLAELARAAVIAGATRAQPKFGLAIGLGLLPRFHNDTAGAAESAARRARIQIVAAGLVTELGLIVLGLSVYAVFHRSGSTVALLGVILSLTAMVYFLLQINPLARRDGYNLLLQTLQVSDLREQALYAIVGRERPWKEGRRVSANVLRLYGVLMLAYMAWVIYWILAVPGRILQASWGSAGVAVVLALLVYSVVSALARAGSQRGSIGGGLNLQLPSRLDWVVVAVLSVLALVPYPYSPSGEFLVLPNQRADARALVGGDVREVLVKEGDTVRQGQVLARLGSDQARAEVAASQADLLRLAANMAIAKAGGKPEEIEAARQEVATAAKRLQFSRQEADRLAAAYKKNAVSAQDYQKALSIAEVNQQQLVEAQKRVTLVQSPARNDQIKAIEADMARVQAQLDFHQKQLDDAEIKALIPGQVVSGSLRYAVGDYLDRGAVLATVEETSKLLVEIRISENDVGQIKVGDRAYAKAFGFPNAGYSGVVQQIAPSAEKSSYGKVVRVLMAIDTPDGRLKPEMTGYAKVSVETTPAIVAFTRPVVRFFLVELWSWLP